MVECEWCNPIVAGQTCTLFETTLLMLGWTANDEPVIKVTLPWGVIEDFQVFAPSEEKTYYEPGNETNFRTVVYLGRTEDQKAVFKICKPAAPKKDTKIRCYDKTTEKNVQVTLEAKLEEAAFPYNDIENGYVKFYMNNAYQGADYTDSNGKAYLNIIPTEAGIYTIKAVFEEAGDYNGSEGTCTLTVTEPVKKDTRLTCYDKTTEKNVQVTLEAKLEEAAFPYNDIENGYVKFYMNNAYQGADYTDSNGKAYLNIIPTEAGIYTIKAVFEEAGDYNGSEGTCTLTVTEPVKKDTRLTCYDAETEEGSEATLEGKLESKNLLWHDLEGKQVIFEIDTVDAIFGVITDAEGMASVTFPGELIPPVGTYTFTATFIEDNNYYGSTCEGTLTVSPVGVCEYTGYACDAKIDHDDIPSSATEGSEVTGTVTVDNLCYIGADITRYRVKFTLNGGTPAYSDEFILKSSKVAPGDYPYLLDVLFLFTMPPNDVTLIAEVERCNELGEWGPCEHADHIKTYSIALALYEGPYGVIEESYPKQVKNSSENRCTNTCEDDNPCTADKGAKPEFKVVIKNAGNEKGYFYVKLTDSEGNELDTEPHGLPAGLEPGETTEEVLQPILGGPGMPDSDWGLQIKIVRTGMVGYFKEWNDTKPFMVCYKQVVEDYSIDLNDLPDVVHVGDKITFSGTLSHDTGGDVSSKLIEIMEKDIASHDFIVKGTTNPDGTFAILWTVKKVGGWLEGKTAEFYARFKFNSKEVTSNTVRVSIVGPSITKAIIYGGIAAGLFATGSIAESVAGPKGKAIGVPVILCGITLVSLAGLEGYKIIKEKIPLI